MSALAVTVKQDPAKIIHFHRFPKDPVIRDKWIAVIMRKDWKWKSKQKTL